MTLASVLNEANPEQGRNDPFKEVQHEAGDSILLANDAEDIGGTDVS